MSSRCHRQVKVRLGEWGPQRLPGPGGDQATARSHDAGSGPSPDWGCEGTTRERTTALTCACRGRKGRGVVLSARDFVRSFPSIRAAARPSRRNTVYPTAPVWSHVDVFTHMAVVNSEVGNAATT